MIIFFGALPIVHFINALCYFDFDSYMLRSFSFYLIFILFVHSIAYSTLIQHFTHNNTFVCVAMSVLRLTVSWTIIACFSFSSSYKSYSLPFFLFDIAVAVVFSTDHSDALGSNREKTYKLSVTNMRSMYVRLFSFSQALHTYI